MGRLDAINEARRPKMHGRAMLSGPSGAGKTWTGLGIATSLADAEGRPGSILVIDTEKESALTYADVFKFDHLPWRAPFDPGELADALDSLGDRYAVVQIDSLTHFWRSVGGTLDIADGKIGGWKAARPVQERLTLAMLAVPAHLLLCVRSKMEYLIENGGKTVTRMGLAPIQDDTLVYELNVAFDLDMEHRLTVTKSRTPAVPVGRMYPAGLERKAAEDYAEWLAGGVPPANRSDVDSIVETFSAIGNAETRTAIKHEFVLLFGMPHALTADKVAEARAWLSTRVVDDGSDGGADEVGGSPPASPVDAGSGVATAPDGPGPVGDGPGPVGDAPISGAPTARRAITSSQRMSSNTRSELFALVANSYPARPGEVFAMTENRRRLALLGLCAEHGQPALTGRKDITEATARAVITHLRETFT